MDPSHNPKPAGRRMAGGGGGAGDGSEILKYAVSATGLQYAFEYVSTNSLYGITYENNNEFMEFLRIFMLFKIDFRVPLQR